MNEVEEPPRPDYFLFGVTLKLKFFDNWQNSPECEMKSKNLRDLRMEWLPLRGTIGAHACVVSQSSFPWTTFGRTGRSGDDPARSPVGRYGDYPSFPMG